MTSFNFHDFGDWHGVKSNDWAKKTFKYCKRKIKGFCSLLYKISELFFRVTRGFCTSITEENEILTADSMTAFISLYAFFYVNGKSMSFR